ncbi:arylsulfatase [Nocardioides carbamazepini]|uniref:arylsulfatase n=1 Tax=Nocardioides carbamazepini TaxID=2854259 RepID=UPI0027E22F7C|nr:arylsulfatase [Nocardioides carbamazepini]MCR1783231.1 arylsulfatase [Nocardioides carbamazepini]
MTKLDRTVLPIPDEVLQQLPTRSGALNLESVAAPEGAPNVVIVLIDDMGFGATSAFGGPSQSPTAEELAGSGLRYTRFHTTALCSPTRQALMTGRNHHAVNMASITNLATPVPGYTSVRPRSAATLAEVLRLNGYNTGAFGKMHQTPPWEVSPVGPFDRWPTGEGFERFYGIVAGEANQYAPLLYDGTTPVSPPKDASYHFSEDIVDKSIEWVQTQKVLAPQKPFFLYLSFGATHAPHHVPREWIEKYRGRFDQGWDAERERIVAHQRELGVVPPDCPLTSRHDEIPAWEDLTDDERTVAARLMEAFAGFAEHTDAQVGRLVRAVKEVDAFDNTLFIYIMGDNGASAEGGIHGTLNEIASLNGIHDSSDAMLDMLDEVGGPRAYNHFSAGWAHATNTPYQWTKQVASHWGGTRVGTIVHWPRGIKETGEVRTQWHHVIDVMPTVLEAAGLPLPESVNGTTQQRTDGVSMLYSFDDPQAAERHTTQYFEMFGNRGIYHEGWTACTKHVTPWDHSQAIPLAEDRWELYSPEDWSQADDLAEEMPEKLAELQAVFEREAKANSVLPLDDRRVERFNSDIAGRPDLLKGRTEMVLRPGMRRLHEVAVPNVKNKSHVVHASITVGEDGGEGAIVSQGGRFGGWTLWLNQGVPQYSYNWFARERYDVCAQDQLGPGVHEVRYEFECDDAPGFGRGGTGRLVVDGHEVANGRIERTVPFHTGSSGSTDVGGDLEGAPVIDDYREPDGSFSGEIHWVRISISGDAEPTPPAVNAQIETALQ